MIGASSSAISGRRTTLIPLLTARHFVGALLARGTASDGTFAGVGDELAGRGEGAAGVWVGDGGAGGGGGGALEVSLLEERVGGVRAGGEDVGEEGGKVGEERLLGWWWWVGVWDLVKGKGGEVWDEEREGGVVGRAVCFGGFWCGGRILRPLMLPLLMKPL